MTSRRSSILSMTISTALTVAALQPIYAQETGALSTDSDGLPEILVTSRRVEESIQETPISVSAFGTEDIEQLGITNIGDAARFSPGFTTTAGPTGQSDGFYFIRGVGQVDLNAATDPGVGTYIDGVYLGRIGGASFDTLDIDRIEVLRGPQGTLFGRNTMGGAINVISHTPTGEFGGKVTALGGSYDTYGVKGRVDFPIGETLAGTVSGMWKTQDGYAKRTSDGKTFQDAETSTVRAKFVLTPADFLTATLGFDWTQVDGTSQHQVLTAFNPNPILSPLGVPLVPEMVQYVVTKSTLFDNNSSIDPQYDLDASGASLTLEWTVGAVNVKSITAFRELEQFAANDFDGTPYTFYDGFFDTDQDQFSQELQFSGDAGITHWLVGAYYFAEDAFHNNSISMGGNNGCLNAPAIDVPPPYTSCFEPPPPTPYATPFVQRYLRNNQQFDLDVEALAAFAHLKFEFNDQWSASLGLRWTDETKEQDYNFFIDNSRIVANFFNISPAVFPTFAPGSPLLVPGTPTSYKDSWDDVTPTASLEFRPTDNAMVYLSYAEGFKSGGFTGRPTAIIAGPNRGLFGPISSYDPETLKTYELGLKSQFADNRVRLNLATYFSKYEDIQLLVLGDSGFFETQNAAESEIKGVELEVVALPTTALQLQASASYNDNQYTELDQASIASEITKSDRLPLTPEYTYSLAADYTWDIAGGRTFVLHADYSWRDDVYYGATNFANEFQDSFGLLGARATYTFPDERISLSAYGANLTDEEYFSNGQDVVTALGVAFASVGMPRTWGLEAAMKFGNE